MPTAPPSPERRRRSPLSREEGRRRLIEATISLCRTRPFADVSVREIAQAADVNHGFVHTWFGGKAGLAEAVCDVLVERLTAQVEGGRFAPGVLRSPEVELMVRLIAWLQTDESAAGHVVRRGRPLVDFGREVFEQVYGFDTERATALAELSAAGVVGLILMGEGLGLDQARMADVFQQMLQALVASEGRAIADGA